MTKSNLLYVTWPETLFGLVILSDILGGDLDCIDFPFSSSFLNLKMHVFHLMITHILLPQYDSHTSFSIFDALMIFNIKHHGHNDLPSMMLTHVYSSSFHDQGHSPSWIYLIKGLAILWC